MKQADADTLRRAIREALAAEGAITATALGKAIGRDGSYVRDFLNGRKASLGAAEITAAEKALGLSEGHLMAHVGATAPREIPSARIAPEADSLVVGEKDVPIMGTTVGGERGDFYMNGEVVDYGRRLPGIATRKNVFGVHVEGESMVPKFEPGDLVYAAPGRTPAAGDYVIIELAAAEGERNGPAFLKRWVRRSGNRIICEQHNPAGPVEYDQREVKAVYRIIPLAELAGF